MPSGTTTLGRGKCEQFSLVTFAPQQPMRVLKIAERKICTTDINRPYAKPNVHKSNGNPRFDHLALLDAPATACSALSIALLPLSDHQHPHHHRHHHHHRRRHPHRCCRRRRRILPAVFVSIVIDINIIVLIPSYPNLIHIIIIIINIIITIIITVNSAIIVIVISFTDTIVIVTSQSP